MEEWHDFYVAVTGASAALAGLIFVGILISLHKILTLSILVNRAVTSVILLLTILVISVLLLLPVKSFFIIEYMVTFIGLTSWILITRIDINSFCQMEQKYKRQYYSNILFNQLSVLPYIIGGLVMLLVGDAGHYWLVPAIIFSFIKAVSEAWVLLVEINR